MMTSSLAIASRHTTTELLQLWWPPAPLSVPGALGQLWLLLHHLTRGDTSRPGSLHTGALVLGHLLQHDPCLSDRTWRTPDNSWCPHPSYGCSSIQYPWGRGLPGLEVIEWTDQTISVEEEHNIGYIQGVIYTVYSASAAQRTGINLTGVRHS